MMSATRQRYPLLVALALVLAALAGCTGDAEGPARALGGVDPGRWGTVLRGTVTNEELAPVADAKVRAGDAETTTADDGSFEVLGLPVGTHVVTVETAGYHTQEQTVPLVEGRPALVDFMLVRAPSTSPYLEVFTFVGFEVCSLVLGVFVYGPPTIPCTERPNTFFPVNMSAHWKYVVTEMDWKTQDTMWMILTPPDASCNTGSGTWCWNRLGTHPIRIEGGPNDTANAARYALDGESPLPEGEFILEVGSTYGGMLRNEVNGTFGETCNTAIITGLGPLGQKWNRNLGCGLGYGYSPGIRIEYYASVFHFAAPDDPAAYSGLPDT